MGNFLGLDLTSASTKALRAGGKFAEEKRVSGGYVERERIWGHEAAKAPLRAKIADYFLKYHDSDEQLRLLSLPGLHWQFEHHISVDHPKCYFVGLEWTYGVIELGSPFMPSNERRYWRDYGIKGKDKPLKVLRGDCSRWVWMEIGNFMMLRTADFKTNRKNKSAWFHKRFRNFSCAWIDFTSQLCSETRFAIRELQAVMDHSKTQVPVAITVMAARDDHDSHEGRLAEVCQLLSAKKYYTFLLSDWWVYVNDGIPMLNVMGSLHKRDCRTSPVTGKAEANV